MDFSMQKVCRSCMSESQDMRSVFSSEHNTKISEMLMACASVQVTSNDGLPEAMCVSCIYLLNSAFSFKQLCERTDNTLRECLFKSLQKVESSQFSIEEVDIKEEIESDNSCDKIFLEQSPTINRKSRRKQLPTLKKFNSLKGNYKLKRKSKLINVNNVLKLEENDENNIENSPEFQLTCKFCNEACVNKNYLTRHEKSHALENVEITIGCSVCDKIFVSRQALKNHKKIHYKHYNCKLCDKSFKSPHGLSYHVKRHNGIKDFVCPVESCQKKFTIKQALSKHLTLHSAEKKHLCSECGKSYSTYDSLSYHLKQHLGQRPYLCIHCGKTFKQSCHLKAHMWVHSGIKPHKCEGCGNRYTSGHQLKKHLRRHCGKNINNTTGSTICDSNTEIKLTTKAQP